ncbi:hypothetical protein [Parasedimentitalea huanghaiensis]|uniref:Phosphoadenosine phosphosulfate reductase n=1 Tax=Parasedimentitalea huanghaiensis TaxID=2682100 RepID=A0A6L6WL51_9RHOB|nr:hypothetical protein [Zongyanglinia huanghaiensis]MVO17335.1 hypothetical protein [Zongyanglinia huanghaiensis]
MEQARHPVDETWSSKAPALIGDKGQYKENGKHSFTYIPRGPVLCVTFDNLDIAMNKREDRLPWGYSFIERQGWSMLGVMAEGWTWYRDQWVSTEFDKLKHSGFFRQFEKVIFYGASMGAYGALVYSAACPGAHVVAFSPQTTLDKSVVPWEKRYSAAWGYDYSGPYGDAAQTTFSAARVNLFYDPYSRPDRAHIDRLSGSNLQHFRCPFLGHRLGSLLQMMGLLQPLVLQAIDCTLTTSQLQRDLRKRRDQRRFRKELVERAIAQNHPILAAQFCRSVLSNGRDRFFETTLAELTEAHDNSAT